MRTSASCLAVTAVLWAAGPATARHVRLNVLEAIAVPTIWEVQLFAPKGAKKKGI